jgi:tetratricopeptide (TPR) repeat protein
MRIILLLSILFAFKANCQEKRLALVIGNANYTKDPLKNPVNDAFLMKQTFESLGFDVIIDTNIETRNEFYQIIKEYHKRRENYTVGFVYYAGHAVQIDGFNYMLATRESYESISDVKYNGLDVGIFLNEYTDPTENEVNVLILDACRNNPFEQNWTGSSRSLSNGSGLAEMSSMGNLVAFSTAAGATAKDGIENSTNSIYCQSLSKNMQIENIDLDNVFRNVRKEVREITGGTQMPAYYNQLEGHDFFLKRSSFTNKILEIDSLIELDNFSLALEKTSSILALSPNNKDALLRRGRIQYNTVGTEYDGIDLFKARDLYPKDPEVYIYLARYYATIGQAEKGLAEIEKSIGVDSTYSEAYFWKARILYENLKKADDAFVAISEAIRFSSKDHRLYDFRATIYEEHKRDCINAIADYSEAIRLNSANEEYWFKRGLVYDECINDNVNAIKEYEQILKFQPNNVRAIYLIGTVYEEQQKIDLALKQYDKGILLENNSPENAALCYHARASIRCEQGNYEDALKDYNRAIEISKEKVSHYENRAIFFRDYYRDYDKALEDINEAIRLDPDNVQLIHTRGDLYSNYLKLDKKAVQDYEEILKIEPDNANALNSLGLIFKKQGKLDLAIIHFNKGIELKEKFPAEVAFCYQNRAELYAEQGQMEEAFKDLDHALSLAKENPEIYFLRSLFYRNHTEDQNLILENLNESIRLDPTNIIYLYERAIYYDDYIGNDEKALQDYEQILKIDPKDIDAINAIGLIYLEQGRFNQALDQFKKGITFQNTNPNGAAFCYGNIAAIYAQQEKYEEALTEYSVAIQLAIDKGPHFYNRAKFYQEYMEEYEKALEDLNEAIRLEPKNTEYLFDRGYLFALHLENDSKALIDWQNVLKIDPFKTLAINNIGALYEKQNKIDLAIEQYTMGIELKNSYPDEAAYCYGNRASLYVDLGRLDEALSDYSKSIELADDKAFRYQQRGIFFRDNKEEYANALEDFSEAIKLAPSEIDYLYSRGTLLFDYLKDENQALKDFQEILRIDPGNIDAINYVGLIYESQGKTDLAIKEYEKGIALEIENPISASFCYRNRAEVYAKLELLNEAHKDYSKAIELDPQNSDWYYVRATFYEEYLNDYNKALLDYSMSIQLDPDDIENWYARALLYKDYLGNLEGALEDGKQILNRDSLNIKAMNLCATVYLDNEELDSAFVMLNKGITINSIDKESTIFCYLNRADIYAKRGEFEKSIEDYNKAITLEPDNANSYLARAWFYYDYKFDLKRSIQDFDRAIELDEKNPNYYLNRSLIHLKHNDAKSQIKDLNQAIKLSPNDPQLYCERGIVYAHQRQFEKAESDYNQAYLLDTLNYNVHLFRSKLFVLKGEMQNALKAIDQAIEIDPNDPEHYFMRGKIFEHLGSNLQAAKNYALAEGLIEQGDYYITDDNALIIEETDIIYRIGQFYEKINEHELACEEYSKAFDLLKNDYRYYYLELKKVVEQKMGINCTNN